MKNRKRSAFKFLLLCCLLFCSRTTLARQDVLIFAAASTRNAVSEIIKLFNASQDDVRVKASFASSSLLAKQIMAGAPAHIYLSANPRWMDYLQSKQLIDATTRKTLLGNQIVLISPQGSKLDISMHNDFDFAAHLKGRLCMGDPDHVPAGTYAKQALQHMQWWDGVKPKLVGTKDVRAALALVERGECDVGVVYATDAGVSSRVEVIGRFPEDSHAPVEYRVASVLPVLKGAQQVLTYLSSPAAQVVYQKYGFIPR